MRHLLLGILYFLSACIAVVIAFIIISNRPLPRGVVGPGAEELTDSMMAAVNWCAEWEQLRFVAFSYQDKHHYVWDKYYNLVEVHYDDVRVLLNVNTVDGIVWKDGNRLPLDKKRKYLSYAWKIWTNDSFWLNPVCKLRDSGVVRRIVQLHNNKVGLLATFTRSGVTPGDSYLFIPDENFQLSEWRMWTRMLPVRGLKASWEQWTATSNISISTLHHIGPYKIEIGNLRSGRLHSELGLERDPFADFIAK